MEHSVDTRLAVYGTLAPGKSNHDQVAFLKGTWRAGTVNGRLLQKGWAFEQGYPAIVLETDGPQVVVQLFESLDLPANWNRLDEFEGAEYRRVVTVVETENGSVEAWIYESAEFDDSLGVEKTSEKNEC